MRTFCQYIPEALFEKFTLNVDVYVSRNNRLAHFPITKSLLSYDKHEDIIAFIYKNGPKQKFILIIIKRFILD